MGYTTDFEGKFELDKTLTPDQRAYLQQFSATGRTKRNSKLVEEMEDPLRKRLGLPVGEDGAYYVGPPNVSNDCFAEFQHESVLDGNVPRSQPAMCKMALIETGKCQPGLWYQWVPTDDGKSVQWDGGEKFYYYVELIKYLIEHFLKRWEIKLNGIASWKGEQEGDTGDIIIVDNEVTTKAGVSKEQTATEESEEIKNDGEPESKRAKVESDSKKLTE